MRILISGATGQLGLALIQELLSEERGFVDNILLTVKGETEWASLYDRLSRVGLLKSALNIHAMDITDENAVNITCKSFMPDVIINCSAYTLVEEAEEAENREMVTSINVDGVRYLAKVSEELSAKFVHISTDFVFDGEKKSPYLEEDEKKPLNFYGETKSLGEEEVKRYCEKFFVIRTSWLYGEGKNFVKTMLSLSETRKEVKVVANQIGTPTSAKELARLIAYLIQTEKYGIWHGSAEGETSWHGFAEEIMRLSKREVSILPILDVDYVSKAKRPRYSVLSKEKLYRETNFRMKDWKEALREYLTALLSN